jgi:CelD/BcsL family acetyltransferase involved in cellulose biosynthesis
MELQLIDQPDEFFRMRDEWDALLGNSVSDCVFLTHDWLSTWWKHLAADRRLSILAARDGDRLVGLLPLAERTAQVARMIPRTLEFIASGVIGSDYLDVIIAKEYEPEVMRMFSEYLSRRGMMLQFSQLRVGSSRVSLLADHLAQNNWIVSHFKQNVCPYIDLRGHTWESYLGTVGPTLRKNVNRYLRNLPKDFDMRLLCAQSKSEAQPALDETVMLHRKRWEAAGKSEAFQSAAVLAFHREFVDLAAERGWLRLLVLYLDDKAAAALYGLLYKSTFYFYQSGFDPDYGRHSVGAATMALAIKTAIEQGAAEYDFLHGDEEYKLHWTDRTRDLGRLELYPPHTRGHIYRHAIHFNRAARRMARRVLNVTR